MFERVDPSLDIVKLEHGVLEFWERSQAFDKLRELRRGQPHWSFLDGPITANNPMGVHHAWGRTYKDVYNRYFAMTGHELRYQNGFDCQGLWVEVEVEKEFGFKNKREIEAYGLEEFIKACKARVLKYAAVQTKQSVRLGMWMDWDNSYFTMSDENNYAIWGFLKKCHEQGLLYKGMDAMPWCPRCGTGISEQERKEGYKRVDDTAIFARFPLHVGTGRRDREYLLVWTTTPWTLPANVACAVNPALKYARARQHGDTYYLSVDCLAVLKEKGAYEVLGEVTGEEMVGWTYDGPFDELPVGQQAKLGHRVIPWSEVAATDGTGIVHIAPGCGKEDFELGKEFKLPMLAPINEEGIYYPGYGFLEGRKAQEVADAVQESLREKGMYYKRETYSHDYPHCWRCGTALLFRAVNEWYINMKWRDRIAAVVDQARWIPEWGRDQEHDWLRNMGDWMISKKRYWGLALPIFPCSCGSFDVIGSKEELQARAVEGWAEFEGNSPHRPWVDRVKIACSQCGQKVSRIPDVGNPWLDAGIVAYSTTRYFTDREYWKKWIPADLVLESFPGQFRNWFYALLAMSTMMEDVAPFKALVGYALVKDEKGEEMHKSKGNAIWFDDAADSMGADVMRWIFSKQTLTSNLLFGPGVADQTKRKFFRTWWNVYSFFVQYANADGFDANAPAVPFAQRPDIDRWLLSKLNTLVGEAAKIADFDIAHVARAAEDFVEDLSNWYVRRNRRRFWRARSDDDRDKLAAYQTLYETLVTLAKLLAPMAPFTCEAMYQNLVRGANAQAPESVHHCGYPKPGVETDTSVMTHMDVALRVVKLALSLREGSKIRVRQPLSRLSVAPRSKEDAAALQRYEAVILDELNIKKLEIVPDAAALVDYKVRENRKVLGPRFGKLLGQVGKALAALDPASVARAVQAGKEVTLSVEGEAVVLQPVDIFVEQQTRPGMAAAEDGGLVVALDLEITPELKREGLARDMVRNIQELRKTVGLDISDRIAITYHTDAVSLTEVFQTFGGYIGGETLAVRLSAGPAPDGHEIQLDGAAVRVRIEKMG
jgi:isoleucyl-tRNA synthetase